MRAFFLAALLLLFVSAYAAPQIGELRLSGSGAELKGVADLIDPDGLARDELRVSVASEAEYRQQDLSFTNVARDLSVAYQRLNRRRGEITISFAYAPVEDLDILLRLEWSDGAAWQHWFISQEAIQRASDGDASDVVRIQARPSRRPSPPRGEQPRPEDMTGLRIDTSRGDNWRNVADTIRQAYLRQEAINTEQVMLALRAKNPDAFTGPSDAVLRVGVSLVLPDYYEIQVRNNVEARAVVRRLLARQIATRSRLELSAGEDAGRQAAFEERDAAKRAEQETTQQLASVDTQLGQVEKLIELKQEQLGRIEEVVTQADQAPDPSSEPAQSVRRLLERRLQQVMDEARSRPVFWTLAIFAVLLAAILLFLLNRFVRRRSLSPRARASLMRDLRRQGGQQRRSLFEPEDADAAASKAVTAPSAPPPKRPTARTDDRAQDDVTNANLDLARAYINMGEAKKARALLDTVLEDGTEAEKARAKKLLASID